MSSNPERTITDRELLRYIQGLTHSYHHASDYDAASAVDHIEAQVQQFFESQLLADQTGDPVDIKPMLDRIEKRLEKIRSRVEALETQVDRAGKFIDLRFDHGNPLRNLKPSDIPSDGQFRTCQHGIDTAEQQCRKCDALLSG